MSTLPSSQVLEQRNVGACDSDAGGPVPVYVAGRHGEKWPYVHLPAHARAWAKCLVGIISLAPYNSPAKQLVSMPIL